MSQRKIVYIGIHVPGDELEEIDFYSDQSLLDADIVLFEPTLGEITFDDSSYQGKRSLGDHNSFRLQEQLQHWRSELDAAIKAGKLVIVFLAKPEEVFVRTGERQFSGTGRNRQVTNIVTGTSSYRALPFQPTVHVRRGSAITRTRDLGAFAAYWDAFGDVSPYEVTLESKATTVLLNTKTGEKVVGATLEFQSGGAVHLLPPVRLEGDKYVRENEETGLLDWTDDALIAGKRFVSAIIALDDAIKSDSRHTPPPDWTLGTPYRMQREYALEAQITAIGQELEARQQERGRLIAEHAEVGTLRRLLYAQGKELETSIIDALRLLGFVAQPYEDAESEFDVVFTSPEGGRFLGEAEGKDSSAVSIDKLSQLERNIQEDFTKDGVTSYASGVLFGNAHRLKPPAERGDAFTAKCITGAQRSGIALVRTTDLFEVARYQAETPDAQFAAACRAAIAGGGGAVVAFPPLPVPPIAETGQLKAIEGQD